MSTPDAKARLPLGVLVSGSGSNLQAILDACAQPDSPAEVRVVISNVATAYGLERARKAGVATAVLDHKAFPSRDAFDAELAATLQRHGVELVCLAGFMRIIGAGLLRPFAGRVINIHPALLPAFPGLHGPRQALLHGAKIAGCTVHFVDEGTDTGPILVQAAVPVLPDDDEQALAARILEQEHRIYPLAIRLIAEGRVTLEGRVVTVKGAPPNTGVLRNPDAPSSAAQEGVARGDGS